MINGVQNMFSPATGDTSAGGHGPIGNVVAGLPCEVEMSNNYHIHVFVGVIVNGQQYALPVGTGAVEPTSDHNKDSPSATQCFYFTHTHDSTGVVHIESDNGGVPDSPPMDTKYTLGQWFQVWGINVSYMGWNQFGQFGQYSGPMEVLTSGQVFRGVLSGQNSTVPESDLTPYVGDPNQIPLYSHEVIWFLIGPQYPASLPSVRFFEQF